MDTPKVSVSIKKAAASSSRWSRLNPYISSIFIVIFFIISLMMNGDISPLIRRGFYCDDHTLNYPFKAETIPLKVLMVIALIVPGLVIKVSDLLLNRLLNNVTKPGGLKSKLFRRKRRKVSDALDDDDRYSVDGDKDIEEEELMVFPPDELKRRHQPIVNDEDSEYEAICDSESSLEPSQPTHDVTNETGDEEGGAFTRIPLDKDYGGDRLKQSSHLNPRILQKRDGEFQLFMFGFCTTMLFTGIGKMTLGRFRPHFLQRCQPDIDCSLQTNANRYIQDYTCTNQQLKPRDLSYISTSWPSGHAAIIFYSMIHLMIYLNAVVPVIVRISSRTIERRSDPLVLYAIYILMLCLAFYTAMTRISDYHHHPLDVASGAIIGTIIAIVWSKSLSRNHLQQIAAAY